MTHDTHHSVTRDSVASTSVPLLRRILGTALREHRLGQRRTLREVSGQARVSLGYLSEVERGQKEASSELLASICTALGLRLADVLREVSDEMALIESFPAAISPAVVAHAPIEITARAA